jgi:broad specificity phosphatase PhoE
MPHFFLRHCQSVFNATGLQVPDIELSEAGKQHASTITGQFDIVICSPLKRARQTLELSRIVCGAVEHFEDAREIPDGNIINHYPSETPVPFTQEDVDRRLTNLREKIKGYPSSTRVLVVGHHTLFHKLLGMYFHNGQLSEVTL